jgi:hypothetical protein
MLSDDPRISYIERTRNGNYLYSVRAKNNTDLGTIKYYPKRRSIYYPANNLALTLAQVYDICIAMHQINYYWELQNKADNHEQLDNRLCQGD